MSEPTYEELKARLSQLEKEVDTKKRSGDLIFKVGEKGGVSVDIKKFLEENKSRLKLKEQG